MRGLCRYWLAFTLVAAAFVTSLSLYSRLPPTIAIHWSAQGADGWAPKSEGSFIAPGFAGLLVAFLILIEPWALGNGEDAATQLKAFFYPTVVAGVAGIAFYVNTSVLLAGVGSHLDVTSHATIGAGLLLAVLGNAFGKAPQYRADGVWTPHAPAYEGLWARTQRVAGWLLMLAGSVTVVAEILGDGMLPGLISIAFAALTSIGYSYFESRRLKREQVGSS